MGQTCFGWSPTVRAVSSPPATYSGLFNTPLCLAITVTIIIFLASPPNTKLLFLMRVSAVCVSRFTVALFAWLINHQPAVLFSHNKPATNNQSVILFSQNKAALAICHRTSRLFAVEVSTGAAFRGLLLVPATCRKGHEDIGVFVSSMLEPWNGESGDRGRLCCTCAPRLTHLPFCLPTMPDCSYSYGVWFGGQSCPVLCLSSVIALLFFSFFLFFFLQTEQLANSQEVGFCSCCLASCPKTQSVY
jgi:hypothetical protein